MTGVDPPKPPWQPPPEPTTFERITRGVRRRFAQRTARLATARSRRRRWVLVVGDSHAAVFREASWARLPVRLEVHAVGGATLTGLPNPKSSTLAGPKLRAALDDAARRSPRPEAVVALLGEVDCGYILWRRHEQFDEPLAPQLDRAIEHYGEFLAQASPIAPTIVVSAPLPTMDDLSTVGEYAGLRREVRAGLSERMELTRELNRRIGALCAGLGLRFIDLDERSVGPDGRVHPLLMNPDPTDHHYDRVAFARMLERELGEVVGFHADPIDHT